MKSEEKKYLSIEILNLFYSFTGEESFIKITNYKEFEEKFPEFEKLYQQMHSYLFENENNLNEITKKTNPYIVTYLKGALINVKEYNIQSFGEYDVISKNLRMEDWGKIEDKRRKLPGGGATLNELMFPQRNRRASYRPNVSHQRPRFLKSKDLLDMFKKNKID